jgi:hypothetical protein
MIKRKTTGLLSLLAVLAAGGALLFGGAAVLFALWVLFGFAVVFVFSAVAHVFLGVALLSFWKMLLLAVGLRLALSVVRVLR